MSMVTRCPNCSTTFRVTLQHLRARDGFVRCGRCLETFNALTTLGALTDDGETRPMTGVTLTPEPSDDFLVPAGEPRGPWLTLTIIAAIALALQGVSLFRMELASRFPQIAPPLQALCGFLGCSLEPNEDPHDLAIADSDLRADPARAQVVILSATVSNNAHDARAFPALELTLTDRQNRLLARRVILPNEYLKRAGKIPPRAEVPLELTLNIGNLDAAGYQLYLFYP